MPRRTRYLFIVMLLCLAVLAGRVWYFFDSLRETVHQPPLAIADFPLQESGSWLHSTPLSLSQLRGKVVLLFIWTFD